MVMWCCFGRYISMYIYGSLVCFPFCLCFPMWTFIVCGCGLFA